MLCVPIVGPTHEQAHSQMTSAVACGADLVEFRLDLFAQEGDERPVLASLIRDCTVPALVTCRSVDHGGRFSGEDNTRTEWLEEAGHSGAKYIDLEFGDSSRRRPDCDARVILSHHDTDGTPDDLRDLCAAMADTRPAFIKIACTAQRTSDIFKVFDLLLDPPTDVPIIAFCMGPYGAASRLLGPKFGSAMQFAALAPDYESAPGQATVTDMQDVFRYRAIKRSTRVYGVVGNPVEHSISPHLFNRVFELEGIDAVYVPFRVDSFGEFIERAGDERYGIDGLSVTLPWKEAAFQMLESGDKTLQAIGACNTLKRFDDVWTGTNTDYKALVKVFDKVFGDRKGLRFAVLGAGGAARAVAKAVQDRGGQLTIFNRSLDRAKRLAKQYKGVAQKLDDLALFQHDVIVNTTPVGMSPDLQNTPAPAGLFRKGMLAADLIYNPRTTRFLKEADDSGAATLPGRDIFVAQAAFQYKFWTDREPPVAFMSHTADSVLSALEGTED